MRLAGTGKRVLSISSQVVFGPVGNSASVPGLQRAGHEVLAVPTVVWPHHPGFGAPQGCEVPGEQLAVMLDGLTRAGALDRLDGLLSGYFRTSGQIDAVVALKKKHHPGLYLCDPVIGDDGPGMYVDEAVAVAIRDKLLPLADIAMPNRFELEWLSGLEVKDVEGAVRAMRRLPCKRVVVTSVPHGTGRMAAVSCSTGRVNVVDTQRRAVVPHGTGDLLAGLVLAALLSGCSLIAAVREATLILEKTLDQSNDETLNLAGLWQ